MFSVKISSVKGISIFSKTRSEYFNSEVSGGDECKIQAAVVNARIKNFTKKFRNSRKADLQSKITAARNHKRKQNERALDFS